MLGCMQSEGNGSMIRLWFAYLIGIAIGAVPAAAAPDLAQQAARRFPQPVIVGTLIGRDVLAPNEAQPILGHVAAVDRRPDGKIDMILRYGGVLGIGSRLIAVPVDAMALLGEYVAVVGYTPAELNRFPPADPAAEAAVSPGETIRVGLVGPFH
jgi:hypothetical protein